MRQSKSYPVAKTNSGIIQFAMTGLDKANNINGNLTKPLPVNDTGIDHATNWVQHCIRLIDTGCTDTIAVDRIKRRAKRKVDDYLKVRAWLNENQVPHNGQWIGTYNWAITLVDKNYFDEKA